MSNNIRRYKGYFTAIQCDFESGVLWGKIEGIDDLITFEGDTIPEVTAAFEESVDDYLDYCAQIGKQPEKAYSGSFNVRVPSELHKAAAERAFVDGKTLNQVVATALESYLKPAQAIDLTQWQRSANFTQYAATSSSTAERPQIIYPQF